MAEFETFALVVTPWGEFMVMQTDFYGNNRLVYQSNDLSVCLKQAAALLGYPLGFPIKQAPWP